MIRHFAADGSVKREWAEGLHASAGVRNGKLVKQIQGSNAILAEIELADGEQVGETFIPWPTSADVAADVHPIESALSAAPLAPVAIAPEPEPSDVVLGTGADEKPFIPEALTQDPAPQAMSASVPIAITETVTVATPIAGSVTEHHVTSASEIVETAAHALSDAAAVLKAEEERNASLTGAEK